MKLGDSNTNFFSLDTRNSTLCLLNQEVGPMFKRRQMEEKSINYFSKVFKSSDQGLVVPLVSFPMIVAPEMNQCLVQQTSEKKAYSVLFSFRSGKSPGSDGFTDVFFQKFWSELKNTKMVV